MLHKELRINRGKDYSSIYKKSKKIRGNYVIVFARENHLNHNRFGIVTSKKIGNAVVRNRAKRQIREIIRININKIQIGYDVVIVAKFNIKEAIFEKIEIDLLRIIKKAIKY